MEHIKIQGIKKEFSLKRDSIKVLNSLSFVINKKEFVTIFGPNGCGKTTFLKILSGFDPDYKGKIKIKDSSVEKIRSYLVFQNPDDSLFNWLSVKENIELGVKEIIESSSFYQASIGGKPFSHFKDFYPYQLSSGLKQLAVLMRAFNYGPELLLLDEPFSSIDYKTSIELEDLLLDFWGKTKNTIVFVSHNIEEAIYLADKVVVLSNSPSKVKKVIQVDLPRPRNQRMKLSNDFQKIKKEILECFLD